MKTLLLACAVALATGCVVVPAHHGGGSSAAVRSDKGCPPGHQWSDGQCHDRGKGHDKKRYRD